MKRQIARDYADYRKLRRDLAQFGHAPATVIALTVYLKSLRALWRVL